MEKPTMPHISVCVPTLGRPRLLLQCLLSLQNQHTAGFTFSISVVDNDALGSSRKVVAELRARSQIDIRYDVEPERNISLTRNRAIANSAGDMVAFIDDDEVAEPTWLATLLSARDRYGVDGVLAPVLPRFSGSPPAWLVRSRLCIRDSFPTGTALTSSRYMRTGNALLLRNALRGEDPVFDPLLGRSGGEDADLFDRLLLKGRSFVWCNEAPVHEEVPPERQTRAYHIRRALIRGVTTADQERPLSLGTVKSVAAVVLYALSLPVLLVFAHHMFMRLVVKGCDHAAKLLAHCGIRLVNERTF